MKREFKVSMFIVKYRFGSECAVLAGLPVSQHYAYDKKFDVQVSVCPRKLLELILR